MSEYMLLHGVLGSFSVSVYLQLEWFTCNPRPLFNVLGDELHVAETPDLDTFLDFDKPSM